MRICSSCEGFAPESLRTCPNCDTAFPATTSRRAGHWLKTAAGSAVAMTLMACYGAPPGGFPPGNDPAADGVDPTKATPDAERGEDEKASHDAKADPDAKAGPDPAEAKEPIVPPQDTARIEDKPEPDRVPPSAPPK